MFGISLSPKVSLRVIHQHRSRFRGVFSWLCIRRSCQHAICLTDCRIVPLVEGGLVVHNIYALKHSVRFLQGPRCITIYRKEVSSSVACTIELSRLWRRIEEQHILDRTNAGSLGFFFK